MLEFYFFLFLMGINLFNYKYNLISLCLEYVMCFVIVLNYNYYYLVLVKILEGCICFISLIDKNVFLIFLLILFKKFVITWYL